MTHHNILWGLRTLCGAAVWLLYVWLRCVWLPWLCCSKTGHIEVCGQRKKLGKEKNTYSYTRMPPRLIIGVTGVRCFNTSRPCLMSFGYQLCVELLRSHASFWCWLGGRVLHLHLHLLLASHHPHSTHTIQVTVGQPCNHAGMQLLLISARMALAPLQLMHLCNALSASVGSSICLGCEGMRYFVLRDGACGGWAWISVVSIGVL